MNIPMKQYLEELKNTNPALASTLHALTKSAIEVYTTLSSAQYNGQHGATETINIQGEIVQELDIIADTIFTRNIKESLAIAGILSEEHENIICFNHQEDSPYILALDPLDGSSNIDTNNSIGTIFSIFQRKTPQGTPLQKDDFLQKGKDCLCAGYIIYGSVMHCVFTLGNGLLIALYAHGEFHIIREQHQLPEYTHIYSVNAGYIKVFDQKTQFYLTNIISALPYSLRYVGSLVADIHRTLIKGGIFLYPTQYHEGKEKNKLRLLYECIPIAFLIEQAGGKASNGIMRLLDIQATSLHQRSALYCGSSGNMSEWEEIVL